MNYWQHERLKEARQLNNPEHVVRLLMTQDFFCPKEKKMKPYTIYRIAKETGLSWHTVKKATRYCDLGYSQKTKACIKGLVQIK